MKRVMIGLGVLAAVLFIFRAGMMVGYRQAKFGGRLGDNYYRAFGEGGRFDRELPGGFPNAHGVAGKIVGIALPTFVVADRDGVEKIVLVTDDTVVRRFRDEIEPEDMRADEFAVIIGSPNEEAQIEAKLIRIMPPLPEGPAGSPMGPAMIIFRE